MSSPTFMVDLLFAFLDEATEQGSGQRAGGDVVQGPTFLRPTRIFCASGGRRRRTCPPSGDQASGAVHALTRR